MRRRGDRRSEAAAWTILIVGSIRFVVGRDDRGRLVATASELSYPELRAPKGD